MFRLKRKYEFHAARKLTALQENHPCGELHGHTFTITIKVSGNQISCNFIFSCFRIYLGRGMG